MRVRAFQNSVVFTSKSFLSLLEKPTITSGYCQSIVFSLAGPYKFIWETTTHHVLSGPRFGLCGVKVTRESLKIGPTCALHYFYRLSL